MVNFTIRLNAGKPEKICQTNIEKKSTSNRKSCCHVSHRAPAHCSGSHLLVADSHRWRREGSNSEKHFSNQTANASVHPESMERGVETHRRVEHLEASSYMRLVLASPPAFQRCRLLHQPIGSRYPHDRAPLGQKQRRWFSTPQLARDLGKRQSVDPFLPELFFWTLKQCKSQASSSSFVLNWPSYFIWNTPTPLKQIG